MTTFTPWSRVGIWKNRLFWFCAFVFFGTVVAGLILMSLGNKSPVKENLDIFRIVSLGILGLVALFQPPVNQRNRKIQLDGNTIRFERFPNDPVVERSLSESPTLHKMKFFPSMVVYVLVFHNPYESIGFSSDWKDADILVTEVERITGTQFTFFEGNSGSEKPAP